MTTRQFAAHIGVSTKTITDAENDKRDQMRKILLNAWSLGTGVPAEWLLHGDAKNPRPGGDGDDGVGCAARESNPQPADNVLALVRGLLHTAPGQRTLPMAA